MNSNYLLQVNILLLTLLIITTSRNRKISNIEYTSWNNVNNINPRKLINTWVLLDPIRQEAANVPSTPRNCNQTNTAPLIFFFAHSRA